MKWLACTAQTRVTIRNFSRAENYTRLCTKVQRIIELVFNAPIPVVAWSWARSVLRGRVGDGLNNIELVRNALLPVVAWSWARSVLRGRVGDGLGRGAGLGIRPWDCFP